ncbi:MAG: hypothetical protein HRU36_02005 [Rickettsiales bacterium]|nr:hypothetical protein [Rickettsiales bacterium]
MDIADVVLAGVQFSEEGQPTGLANNEGNFTIDSEEGQVGETMMGMPFEDMAYIIPNNYSYLSHEEEMEGYLADDEAEKI